MYQMDMSALHTGLDMSSNNRAASTPASAANTALAGQYGLTYNSQTGAYYQPGSNQANGGGLTQQGMNQYAESGIALQASQQAANTAGSVSPIGQDVSSQRLASMAAGPGVGQDVFSQKLAGMANGAFSPDDPSYQWRLQQGQQAVERSAAAKGQIGSGNLLTELTQYGQGMASQEYGAQYNRMLQGSQNATSQYQTQFNTLLAGSQNATQQYGQAYQTLAGLLGTATGQGSMQSQQAAQGTQANQVAFGQRQATNSSQGAQDALSQLYNNGNQQAQQNQQYQQPVTPNGSYSMNGYQPATGGGTVADGAAQQPYSQSSGDFFAGNYDHVGTGAASYGFDETGTAGGAGYIQSGGDFGGGGGGE